MKNKKIIIFNIVFNNLRKKHVPPRPKPETVLTPNWINERMKVFMNNTLKSLQNQTNQNFMALIRYEESTESLVQSSLKQYPNLPQNVVFIKNKQTDAYIKSIIKDYKDLYLVRLDSDDMYYKSFVDLLHNYNPHPKTKVLINKTGFIYDAIHNQMAIYNDYSPPFFTLVYNTSDYLKGIRYPVSKHKDAIKLPHEILKGRNFVVNIHSTNTSSQFRTKDGIVINPAQTRKLLKDFKGE